MSNSYSVTRVLGADRQPHNNKYGVERKPAHSSTGTTVFVAAGDKAKERADFVCALFSRERTGDEERFLQRILKGEVDAEAELRTIVGAKPRSQSRGGRFRAAFA